MKICTMSGVRGMTYSFETSRILCTDLVWHLLKTIQSSDVIQCVYRWRQTAMQTEDLQKEKT